MGIEVAYLIAFLIFQYKSKEQYFYIEQDLSFKERSE